MNKKRRQDVDPDDDVALLTEVEKWQAVLRDTVNIALEQDGVRGSKVKIAKDERASLQCAARNLYAIDELLKVIKGLTYQHERAHALMCLCSAMGASFMIGSHASVSTTQRVFHHLTAQSKGGKAPRAPTSSQKRMDELIARRQKAKPNASTSAVASWVIENWSDEASPPDKRTIERRIKRLGK